MSYKVFVAIDDEGTVELDGILYPTYADARQAVAYAKEDPVIGLEFTNWFIEEVEHE